MTSRVTKKPLWRQLSPAERTWKVRHKQLLKAALRRTRANEAWEKALQAEHEAFIALHAPPA